MSKESPCIVNHIISWQWNSDSTLLRSLPRFRYSMSSSPPWFLWLWRVFFQRPASFYLPEDMAVILSLFRRVRSFVLHTQVNGKSPWIERRMTDPDDDLLIILPDHNLQGGSACLGNLRFRDITTLQIPELNARFWLWVWNPHSCWLLKWRII